MDDQMTNGDHLCELIFVAFSGEPLHGETWQRITKEIVKSLPNSLDPSSLARAIQTRALGQLHFEHRVSVLEITVATRRKPATLAEMTAFCVRDQQMQRIQREYEIELTLQPQQLYRLHQIPGLAVFDMDSTLIKQEVIDELARTVGLYDKVAAITEAAMRGEAPYNDFEASLRARVAFLKGVPTSIWDDLKANVIEFTSGAPDLIRLLKQLGWKTAVLSGGFTPLADWVKETLGLDYAFANHLATDSNHKILTGELIPGTPIVHAHRKRELLVQLAAENNIPQERTIAVGDGSNDLLMMQAAGLGIAFNAKPKVQLAAPVRLNSSSLLDVMHVLGYSSDHIRPLLNPSNEYQSQTG